MCLATPTTKKQPDDFPASPNRAPVKAKLPRRFYSDRGELILHGCKGRQRRAEHVERAADGERRQPGPTDRSPLQTQISRRRLGDPRPEMNGMNGPAGGAGYRNGNRHQLATKMAYHRRQDGGLTGRIADRRGDASIQSAVSNQQLTVLTAAHHVTHKPYHSTTAGDVDGVYIAIRQLSQSGGPSMQFDYFLRATNCRKHILAGKR